jgi:hypothetical protein
MLQNAVVQKKTRTMKRLLGDDTAGRRRVYHKERLLEREIIIK